MTVSTQAGNAEMLKRYEPYLAELFNVSEVTVIEIECIEPQGRVRREAPDGIVEYPIGDQFAIGTRVERSEKPKCDRCWRHVPDVGQQAKYPTVCLRCAEALDAIDFPPYAATSSSTSN